MASVTNEADQTNLQQKVNSIIISQTQKQCVDIYDDWAQEYEQMSERGGYRGAEIVVEELVTQLGQNSKLRILDVAAGTGWVGRLLVNHGYTNIDALEPSANMIRQLEEGGLYINKYQELLHHNSIPQDSYDVVVVAGGLNKGHIPVSGVDELIRLTKPGGLVVLAINLSFVEYVEELESHMALLEKKGVWEKVSRSVVPNYFPNKKGMATSYRVL